MIEFSTNVMPSMALELQPHSGQANQAAFTPTNVYELTTRGPAWAVRYNGKLVAVGGHTPVWQGRTVLWGYLGADCRLAMPAMTREIHRQLEAIGLEFPRIEAYAERHHKQGHRWLKMLGFKREGVMRKFYNGVDYTVYARVT